MCLEGGGGGCWEFCRAELRSTTSNSEEERVQESLDHSRLLRLKEVSHLYLVSDDYGHWGDHLTAENCHIVQCHVYFCIYNYIGIKKFNCNLWEARRKGMELHLIWEDMLNENQLTNVLWAVSINQESIDVAVRTLVSVQVMIWFWQNNIILSLKHLHFKICM